MNVGYGCNIYLRADARIGLKRRLLDSLTEMVFFFLFVLGAVIIFNTLAFLQDHVTQWLSVGVKYPNIDFLKRHCTSLSTTF